MKSESGFSFAIASQPFYDTGWSSNDNHVLVENIANEKQ